MKNSAWKYKPMILDAIHKKGGWVNAHAHLDRAFTINPDSLDIYKHHSLEEKWDLVDAVKKDASEDEYYSRMCQGIEVMIEQGVSAIGSFIDVDPICEDRALQAALKVKEQYKQAIQIVLINQTLKGVIEKEARYWFDAAAEQVDIIGGLPKRDERDYGKGSEHIDILLATAKKYNKMVHVHVDQFNSPTDKETELLCDKTLAYGMEGKVVAIHGISLSSHPMTYRELVYKKMKQAQLMMIACPIAWIDSRRSEELQPFHNSLTPIDELIPHGIPVALGTDNICDYMVPFCDGDMWIEFTLLMTGCRFPDIDAMIDVATIQGRKVLGLSL